LGKLPGVAAQRKQKQGYKCPAVARATAGAPKKLFRLEGAGLPRMAGWVLAWLLAADPSEETLREIGEGLSWGLSVSGDFLHKQETS
jgi:hypothetical protein